MRINVDNFENVLRKATMNLSINSVQLKIDKEKVRSKMISEDRSNIIILDVENDIIPEMGEEVDFNFSEPAQQLVPFLKLIDIEEAEISLHNEKIVIKNGRQRSNIHFCSPTVVSVFGSDARDVDYFLEMDINEEFTEAFAKIKKIGNRFGKIYFNVEDGKFSIETSDKTNRFSNGLKFDISEISRDTSNLTICFDFKNMTNLMAIINGNIENFKFHFAYIEEQELGMLFAESNDGSEKYYLMSREI